LASFQHTYTTPAGVSEPFENGRFGWTVGGGIDYAITSSWSVGAEYRYTDFGSFLDNSVIAFPGFTERQHPKENEVLVSISYKFGEPPAPAPVIAKY
jgi:outer membrane immunogenic protein